MSSDLVNGLFYPQKTYTQQNHWIRHKIPPNLLLLREFFCVKCTLLGQIRRVLYDLSTSKCFENYSRVTFFERIQITSFFQCFASLNESQKNIGIGISWCCCFAPCCDTPTISQNPTKRFPYFFAFCKLG